MNSIVSVMSVIEHSIFCVSSQYMVATTGGLIGSKDASPSTIWKSVGSQYWLVNLSYALISRAKGKPKPRRPLEAVPLLVLA
jgi:hypothetical protein